MYLKHQQLYSRPAVWRIEQSSIKSKEKKTVVCVLVPCCLVQCSEGAKVDWIVLVNTL